jgi:putative ABC transport system permease protein
MYMRENLQIAWEQIRSSKMRSILTTLGITIGIMTVIFIVAILKGYNDQISNELNMLGANVFQVEKYDRDGGIQIGHRDRQIRKDLKRDYAEVIRERCPSVKYVGAEVWYYNISIRYKDRKTNPSFLVAGGEPEFFFNNAETPDEGRSLSRQDVLSNARVVVLGRDIINELFPNETALGKYVKIAGTKFKVVGTLEDMGSQTFGRSKNNRAIIPISTFEDIFGSYRSVFITVMARDDVPVDQAKQEVIGVMRQLRKVPPGEENDFAIWGNDTLVDSFENTASKIQLGAVLLGGISLLVGSIGVMNIMLVTVTERTREIGIRKALGARRRVIMFQFLNESIVLSLIGGILGVFLGVLFSAILTTSFDMPFTIPYAAILVALSVTTFVGLAAGLYPAARASKLDPIEALRYE